MLISGYFLTERGNDIKIGKIAGKLLGHIAFVTVLLTLVIAVYNPASGKTVRIPDTDFYSNNWWFVGYYFAVVFLGKYWLCSWLNKLSKEPMPAFSCSRWAAISRNSIRLKKFPLLC